MKIGIIYTSFNTQEHLYDSILPWIAAREERPGGHEFLLVAVSVPFIGFTVDPTDYTHTALRTGLENGEIDHIILGTTPVTETDARGQALTWLVSQGVDILWQADGDEIPTTSQIAAAAAFVDKNPLTQWFRLSYRNAVFTWDQYLTEPFTPPRIHRVKTANRKFAATGFYEDNNVFYDALFSSERIKDVSMSSVTVPRNLFHAKHLTWLNDERSRKKVDYQLRRWGTCSFAWDKERGLTFNEEFYAKQGKPLPEVFHE